ncbi:isoleucine--tRNA ligase [Ruminococcaceae bacterium OttesenSCG-928-N02]|nr:isoleucine--tRNA ligase [Ruminococcaceae bacterium OttesenSCG-928-N02]
MYKKVDPTLNFIKREEETGRFWRENQIFEKSIEERKGSEPYVFYDGPPTANGAPHIGHVLTRAVKDVIPRYHAMKGQQVPRKAGWDTHGLPVELEVEKALGINGKEQIEEYGLEPFILKCKESVWKYKTLWEEFSDRVGFWADMEHPYITYENDYIESEWWALKQIWEKGLLYKGFKIVPYCPRCGTPLSSHEVAQGYKDVKERSAIVKFKMKDEDAYILAWTTTPWTLPSNLALCVNPDVTYVKAAFEGQVYYLAQALAPTVLGEGYEELATCKGRELEHKEYEPLFDFVHPQGKCWFVTCADYVSLEDGTGVVHTAPAFGEDDAATGRKYGLPFVQLVDAKGDMTGGTPWDGTFCKTADKDILAYLKEKGLLYAAPVFEHSYPHCWRCDTPLLYYARDSWFIEMTKVKENLIRNNNTINWVPASIGKGRFGDWLENVQDWGISRNRYWGTPLNIWQCTCGHQHAVGSVAELKEMAINCPDDIELHRPYIDAVTLTCEKCGGEMHRTPEVIDCWFDSGAMPFAQHHYPFENKELFEREFPADYISEAVDQTRGWFYSLLAISTLVFDKAPYKNVIVLGHVQDEDGQKMSKSKGNAVDPMQALTTYGADAVRWYFYTNSAPWLPNRFSGKAVTEGQRKFMGTLWNTYAFYVLYANIDGFDPTKYTLDEDALTVMDRWLLSRLNTTTAQVDEHLANYRLPEAGRALQAFVDELSNWYVRRGRERYWAMGMQPDKVNAYLVLYTALETVCRLGAPMVPFITEDIYQNLVRSHNAGAPQSVHLCLYPEVQEKWVDKELETAMQAVLDIVVLGRAARNSANIKNRQPLGTMYLRTLTPLAPEYTAIIAEELNVKKVELITEEAHFISYSFKPQLKTLGPRYGKQLGEIRTALAALDGNAAKRELNTTGVLKLQISTGVIELTAEDLLEDLQQKEGYFAMSEGPVMVALDTELTPQLLEEGQVRELISKVQTMRKEAGFEVQDRIALYLSGSPAFCAVVHKNEEELRTTLLADVLQTDGTMQGFEKQWDMNGEQVGIALEKMS